MFEDTLRESHVLPDGPGNCCWKPAQAVKLNILDRVSSGRGGAPPLILYNAAAGPLLGAPESIIRVVTRPRKFN